MKDVTRAIMPDRSAIFVLNIVAQDELLIASGDGPGGASALDSSPPVV